MASGQKRRGEHEESQVGKVPSLLPGVYRVNCAGRDCSVPSPRGCLCLRESFVYLPLWSLLDIMDIC